MFDMNIQFANQEEKFLAHRLEQESFARQHDALNRRLDEALAKLAAAGFRATKEPPDPPPTATMEQGWQLPPSLTQAPPGVAPAALPRLRVDPPRFDGENAVEWIRNMQNYYNHHYTPLSDRLYLTQYLFDHPASEWMAYWTGNNVEKGWDDFLLAVYHRFAPELTEDDVSHVVDDNHLADQTPIMESTNNIVSNGIGFDTMSCYENSEIIMQEVVGDIIVNFEFDVEQPDVTFEMDAANVVDSFLCVDTSHLYSKLECLSVEEELQFQNCRVNDCILQVRARHIRGDFGDAVGLLDRYGDARTIPPSAPDDVVVLSVASKLVTDSLFVNAHSEVVTHGSDVRIYVDGATPTLSYSDDMMSCPSQLSESIDTSISQPHLALGVESCFLDLMHSKTMEASCCGDSDWSRAPLQFGANNGVHVFNPGAFEPGDSSVGENSSRLQHDNSMHSSCEDADRSKDASKARNIATIMAFEYEQPSIVLVMGVDVEFQLWNCAVELVTDEQMSWDVTWLATSNECDVYGTCIQFWGCDIRASTICSCGRAFELVDKGEKDSGYKWQYATGGTQGGEFIRLLFIKVLDSAHQLASRWVDECRSRFLGNNSCIYVNADYNKIRCMLCNITWIAVRQRFLGVGVDIHICLVSSTFDTKIKEVYAMISVVETMHRELQTLLISGDGALDSHGARTATQHTLHTRPPDAHPNTRRALMCRRYPLLSRTVKNATNGYIVVIIAIDYWTSVVALEMRKINDVDFFLCVNNSKSYSELGYLGMDVELQVPNCKGDRKQGCEDLRLGAVEGVYIFDPGVFKGVETIQVTYSVVESGVDASHCDVVDATEVVPMFQILLYSMVANQSFVKIRVFDFANFGEKFGTAEMLTFMFLIHDPP